METITTVTKNPKRVEAGKKGAVARKLKKMETLPENVSHHADSITNSDSNAISTISNADNNVTSTSHADQLERGKWFIGLGIAGIGVCLYFKRLIKQPTPPSSPVERDPFLM